MILCCVLIYSQYSSHIILCHSRLWSTDPLDKWCFCLLWINRSILCYLSQPSLCVRATTQPALPQTPSSSEATAITPLPSATLFSTTATTNKRLLPLLRHHQRVSRGYQRTTPTRTALSNTSTPKTTTTTTLRTTCKSAVTKVGFLQTQCGY